MDTDRERLLSRTFVELADTLVTGFDIVDFLHMLTERCVEMLGASAAGLMLADQRGGLAVMAASDERAHTLELFELQRHEGPCLDCYTTGQPVVGEDLGGGERRWPIFAAEATAAGFRSVNALPLRLRDSTIGALNLFSSETGGLAEADRVVGQAMADVATIGIFHQRAFQDSHVAVEQMQGALNSRVAIEQAKGLLAERMKVDLDQAFRLLRRHARDGNRNLSDVARELLDGHLSSDAIGSPQPRNERARGQVASRAPHRP